MSAASCRRCRGFRPRTRDVLLMDVVGARDHPARGEGWGWGRWEAPGRLGFGARGERGGVPRARFPRRTPAPGDRSAQRCGPHWLLCGPGVSSSGGPRHHDPEEQVEKIGWQHHFYQLHPQTGRRFGRPEPAPSAVPRPRARVRSAPLGARSLSLCFMLPCPGVQPPLPLLPTPSLCWYPGYLVLASLHLSVAPRS